jgi:4-hydroxy-2-oxoheptanedioate aldolase
MRPNKLREIWKVGKKANNCWLSLASPFGAELIAHQGWDSVTIDLQHSPADFKDALAMLTAVSTTGCVPIVRVPENSPGDICRVLDAGAYGVICPTINTAEEAKRFVSAARYHPQGVRSIAPYRAVLYGGADYVARANETVLTLAQIETASGLANVEAIAKTPGLDMLFVGPSDLGLSLETTDGRANLIDDATQAAIDRILHAARAAGKYAGIFGNTAEFAKLMFAKGFDLVTVTTDARCSMPDGRWRKFPESDFRRFARRIAALCVRDGRHDAQADQNQRTDDDPGVRDMDQHGAIDQSPQQNDKADHVKHEGRHGAHPVSGPPL